MLMFCKSFRPLSGYSFSNMKKKVNRLENIANVFVPYRGISFLMKRMLIVEKYSLLIFVPSWGTCFLIRYIIFILVKLGGSFRPLSGYLFSNKDKSKIKQLYASFRPLSGYLFSNENYYN